MTDTPNTDQAAVKKPAPGPRPPSPDPAPAAQAPGIKPLSIECRPRTGIRNLRGVPTVVPTGHLDLYVDGKVRAWTRVAPGKPIHALAEFLPHEISQLAAAVKQYCSEATDREYRPLPKGTPEQIAALQRA